MIEKEKLIDIFAQRIEELGGIINDLKEDGRYDSAAETFWVGCLLEAKLLWDRVKYL